MKGQKKEEKRSADMEAPERQSIQEVLAWLRGVQVDL